MFVVMEQRIESLAHFLLRSGQDKRSKSQRKVLREQYRVFRIKCGWSFLAVIRMTTSHLPLFFHNTADF